MSTFIDAEKLRDSLSISDFLLRLGHQPVRLSGGERFYVSMLREERTASLCVNDALGVWFDHGGPNASGIRGGNLIDLAIAYWHPISYVGALSKIRNIIGENFVALPSPRADSRKRSAVKLPNYKIEARKALGSTYAITSYLQQRGIWSVADRLIEEIHYFVRDNKGKRKDFFAAGWRNENDGFEVRNKYFQGCLGHKGLSFVAGDEKRVLVFEGYLDFLSWKFENEDQSPNVIVLNSLSLLAAGINRASKYDNIELFFDRDKAGLKASADFISALPRTKDCSQHYDGFKDYNEKLMAEIAAMRMPQSSAYRDVVSNSAFQLRR